MFFSLTACHTSAPYLPTVCVGVNGGNSEISKQTPRKIEGEKKLHNKPSFVWPDCDTAVKEAQQ